MFCVGRDSAVLIFFFKQKTAYEMRISDWSSDVCSSDLVLGALDNPPPVRSQRILNIGDSHPVGLMEMISTLEKALGRTAEKIMRPMQPGDVTATYADV